jgi:hypothetical protein
MELRITKNLIILCMVLLTGLLTSCYYDNEQELYPGKNLPTSNISFSKDVNPILVSRCNSCHATAVFFGNIATETYDQIKVLADNGKLIGSIQQDSGFKPMPQGSAKLSDAQITLINTWITEGAKNN